MTQWHKTRFPGVRYRKHLTRKHGVQSDKYYTITYKYNGKTISEALGWASTGVTAKECYDILSELKRNHKRGDGPQTLKDKRGQLAKKRASQIQSGSVEDLFVAYCKHLKREGKKSSYEVERALLAAKGTISAAEALGKRRKANEISPRDIQQFLMTVHKRAPSMAAHLRAYLHGAFSWGMACEYDYSRPEQKMIFKIASNPVASVPRNSKAFKASDRVLSESEINGVWKGLSSYCGPIVTDAVKLILATGGQRVGEVVEARCSEFDMSSRVWIIPKDRTKNSREHVVPLGGLASEIVDKYLDGGGFLFPGATVEKPLVSTSLNRAVKRYCSGEGSPGWSPRDIRRTCRTMLSNAGEPPHVLNWHFNHGFQGVGEKHYDRGDHLVEKRRVMKRWEVMLGHCLEYTDISRG